MGTVPETRRLDRGTDRTGGKAPPERDAFDRRMDLPRAQPQSGISPWEALRVAFDSLGANKLRSFLTMLGIIIGVAAVITTVAIGQEANMVAQAQIARMGTNVLYVRPGAQRRDILTQFLMESITLSLVGGLLGAGIGLAAPAIVSLWTGWPTLVSLGPVLLSFSFAAAVGVFFFGLYPALQAARLNPIEALPCE